MDDGAGTLIEVASPAQLSRLAADTILAHAARALAERGAFHLALAGGSTPRATYAELARRYAEFDASRWELWYGDERCVPAGHPDSNHGMVTEAWLVRVAAAPRVHPMQGEASPREAAQRYQSELEERLGPEARLDLVLLGLGADGHTASLFPGTTALESRELVTVGQAPQPPHERLTLTYRALNAARAVLFLVAGASKAEALRAARSLEVSRAPVPAQGVRPVAGELLWLADRPALGQP